MVSKAAAVSRSDARDLIRGRQVSFEGEVITDPSKKVPKEGIISLMGEKITYEQYVYYMMNKPKGILSASEDKKEKTVVDLIREKGNRNLFPAGRLDRDTVGFVLITDDGEFAHRILSPSKHVEKEYLVHTDNAIPHFLCDEFSKGVDLGDFTTLPASLSIEEEKTAKIIIREGKYHQIKRMFKKYGLTVVQLKRIRMGDLFLDESLSEGEYKKLTNDEVSKIAQRR